jgi:hypothetical protein
MHASGIERQEGPADRAVDKHEIRASHSWCALYAQLLVYKNGASGRNTVLIKEIGRLRVPE